MDWSFDVYVVFHLLAIYLSAYFIFLTGLVASFIFVLLEVNCLNSVLV
jgi:hypothetical protein